LNDDGVRKKCDDVEALLGIVRSQVSYPVENQLTDDELKEWERPLH
jgi:hypothetical protein